MDSRIDERSELKTMMRRTLNAIYAVRYFPKKLGGYKKNSGAPERNYRFDEMITRIDKVKRKINKCLDKADHVISLGGEDDLNKKKALKKALLTDVFNELKNETSHGYDQEIDALQELIRYSNKDNNMAVDDPMREFQSVIDVNAAMENACQEYMEYLEGIINKDPTKLNVSRVLNDKGEYYIDIYGHKKSQSIKEAIDKYTVVNRMLNIIIDKEDNVKTKLVKLEPIFVEARTTLVRDRSNAAQKFLKAIAAAFADFLGLKKQAEKLRRIEGRELMNTLEKHHSDSQITVSPDPGSSVSTSSSMFANKPRNKSTESNNDLKNNDQKEVPPTERRPE